MANQEHLDILNQGVEAWNQWRKQNPELRPMLSGVQLSNKAHLPEANLDGADLFRANLSGANLKRANLHKAHLREAILVGADFSECNLRGAHFREADLTEAILTRADLSFATLVMAHLKRADLTGSTIYGVSAWDIDADETTIQTGLIISKKEEPVVTVDNLEVGQFISLLLNNKKIRDVIDTVTSKAVLILGRFTPERKAILDALREELRRHDYLPILFDFEQPSSRNLTETVSTLAHMARFVIADITDVKSIPQELQRIVPDLPSLPVQPLILDSQYEYGMFKDFLDYPWVLTPYRYNSLAGLLTSLEEKVIGPAAAKAKEIEVRRKALEQTS